MCLDETGFFSDSGTASNKPAVNISKFYEKEKVEYANQKVRENDLKRARALLNEGIDRVKIMKTYGFTEEELLRLQNETVTV